MSSPEQGLMRIAQASDALTPLGGVYELAARPAAIYLDRTLGPGSRRTMEQALDVIAAMLTEGKATARTCPWAALRYDFTAGLPAQLKAKGYERTSINKMLSALRGVLLEAWKLELMDHETMKRAGAIRPPKGEGLKPVAGRAIKSGELRALFEACAADPNRSAGDRDSCAIALLYGAGLRRSELVALTLGDFDQETGALTVRHGKGDKARQVYVEGGAERALSRWITRRRPLTSTPTSPLFVPVTKSGRLILRRLTDQAIFDMLRRRAIKAHVPSFSPHDFRRTFIGDLLDAGADISIAQQLAGHASVNTTARYDRRGERAKKGATALLHVPFTD